MDYITISLNDAEIFIDPIQQQPLSSSFFQKEITYLPKQKPGQFTRAADVILGVT